VSVVNLWGEPKAVRVTLDGGDPKRITDLRTGEALEGAVRLAPLRARLLKVE
jgi:hypothetical protein